MFMFVSIKYVPSELQAQKQHQLFLEHFEDQEENFLLSITDICTQVVINEF